MSSMRVPIGIGDLWDRVQTTYWDTASGPPLGRALEKKQENPTVGETSSRLLHASTVIDFIGLCFKDILYTTMTWTLTFDPQIRCVHRGNQP